MIGGEPYTLGLFDTAGKLIVITLFLPHAAIHTHSNSKYHISYGLKNFY